MAKRLDARSELIRADPFRAVRWLERVEPTHQIGIEALLTRVIAALRAEAAAPSLSLATR